MNNSDFLQWCADGHKDAVEHILRNNDGSDFLWTVAKFDYGFGASTQSLLEQGIETSLLHNNRCWVVLLHFLAQYPEQLRGFVFGQLLHWDIDHQVTPHTQNDHLIEVFDTAFDLMDPGAIDVLKQLVGRYCLGWGKWMVEHLEHSRQRKRILNELTDGANDDERKI